MKKILIWAVFLAASINSLVSAQSTITYPQSGLVATEDWVQQYFFEQLEKYNLSSCDLKVVNVSKSGSSLSFGLTSPLQGQNNYSVRISKGDQNWYWNAVPYITGEKITITNVPQITDARITVRPTNLQTCYYSFVYDLSGGSPPDPGNPTNPTDPTDPTEPTNPGGTPNCGAGPTILAVLNPTSTALTGQFHGNGVSKIAWQISLISTPLDILRQGEVVPTSAYVPINYTSLPDGNYRLRFSGVACVGTSIFDFIINTGVPNPTDPNVPVTPAPDPTEDAVQPVMVNQGFPQHMDVQITGSSNNWTINDNSDYALQGGYIWYYFVNGDMLRTPIRLTNYKYESNNPLRIVKMALKTQYDTFNKWSIGNVGGTYYDENAGMTFTFNTSGAYSNYVFR